MLFLFKDINKNNLRHNGEFYVCPFYNELIKPVGKIKIKKVKGMWGLGTPVDLDRFISSNKF